MLELVVVNQLPWPMLLRVSFFPKDDGGGAMPERDETEPLPPLLPPPPPPPLPVPSTTVDPTDEIEPLEFPPTEYSLEFRIEPCW